jgi:hypothetical protein
MEMGAGRQAEDEKIFGQQTPRRWGWGTPLKKRTATRTIKFYVPRHFCQYPGG